MVGRESLAETRAVQESLPGVADVELLEEPFDAEGGGSSRGDAEGTIWDVPGERGEGERERRRGAPTSPWAPRRGATWSRCQCAGHPAPGTSTGTRTTWPSHSVWVINPAAPGHTAATA